MMIGLMVAFTATIQAEDNVTSSELKTFLKAHPTLNTPEMITLLKSGEKEAQGEDKFGKAKFYKVLGFGYNGVTKRIGRKLNENVPNFLEKLTNSNLEFGGISEWLDSVILADEATKKADEATRITEIAKEMVKNLPK